MKNEIEKGNWPEMQVRGRMFGRARAVLGLKRMERRADARCSAPKPKTVRVRYINRKACNEL